MTIGQAADQALTAAVASQGLSTRDSQISSEAAHKRHFLATFRRWSILFKRKDGDVQADKWLVAEYYDSLQHLSETGLDVLTARLKETCIFFPAIRECLELSQAKQYDYGNPFYCAPALFRPADNVRRLAAPHMALTDDRDA